MAAGSTLRDLETPSSLGETTGESVKRTEVSPTDSVRDGDEAFNEDRLDRRGPPTGDQ